MILRPATGDRRFQYKAFHGIPTTVRPLGIPYSDIYDVAATCELRFRYKAFCGIPTTGRPASAVRSSSCPAPPAGRHLTGQKAYRMSPTESQLGDVDVMNSRQIIHGLWPCA